jgi:hypothetical protein
VFSVVATGSTIGGIVMNMIVATMVTGPSTKPAGFLDQAIKTVGELESLGGAVASKASLRIADIYKISGDKAREVGQLRTVLRRYPKTGESAAAHDRLESYGVALVGGESEAEK